jgi:archaellum component FlaC
VLRRKRTPAQVEEVGPALETRPTCMRCGSTIEVDDAFCAACGTSLAAPASAPEPSEAVDQAAVADPGSRVPRWARIAIVVVPVLVVAGAVALLASAWSSERADRRAAEAELASVRQELAGVEEENADLRASLAEVEAELDAAESVVDAQDVVLTQTERVLGRVDPLLSSVDELKLLAAQIQDDRDEFRFEAEVLRDGMVAFANYLIGTSPFEYDNAYISSEIDYLNGQLETFAAAGSSLDDGDRGYARASQRFDNRANRYTKAVRRLESALEEVSE